MNKFAYAFLVVLLIGMLPVAGSAAPVTPAIPYQGKLTDPGGNPLTGSYGMTFTLYDVAAGGAPLSIDKHLVTVTNGLFTTTITVTDPGILDGRALWLGVKVGTETEMTPRQSLQPVPYALGLRPGVVGASFSTSQAGTNGNQFAGVNVSTGYDYNPGVWINTSGLTSEGVVSSTNGINSTGVVAFTNGNYSEGVHSATFGYNSDGVVAQTRGLNSYGVYALTGGNWSTGVGVITEGSNSGGVNAQTHGLNSHAIYGSSQQGIGVIGIGREGAYFTTTQEGTSINSLVGVNVSTRYNYNPGLRVNTSGDRSYGVFARTHGSDSTGLSAETWGSDSDGVRGTALGPSSFGVRAVSYLSSGIFTETNRADSMYGLYTPDYIYARGTQYPAADVAEFMPVTDDVSPGTVLIIGEDGRLTPATSAYDTRVAGIVSTDPGVFLGTKEDGNAGEALIAVAGRVPCKVDAFYGAIHPGDVLTTSSTPGYAMKAQPVMIAGVEIYKPSTVLGKALGTLESGTGTIEVLVTLQ